MYRVLLSIMEDELCDFIFLQQMVFRYEIDQPLLDLVEVGLFADNKIHYLSNTELGISITL